MLIWRHWVWNYNQESNNQLNIQQENWSMDQMFIQLKIGNYDFSSILYPAFNYDSNDKPAARFVKYPHWTQLYAGIKLEKYF